MNEEKSSTYEEISYTELGDYVGNKAMVRVSKDWLDSLRGEIIEECVGVAKECSKCNKILPLERFSGDKRRKFGKRSQCKLCYKDRPVTKISKLKTFSKKTINKDSEKEDKISYTLINLNNEK
jgi:hypothetical protein